MNTKTYFSLNPTNFQCNYSFEQLHLFKKIYEFEKKMKYNVILLQVFSRSSKLI